MDYFEIRYEHLSNTKKYFYKTEGHGLRYEILEFVRLIDSHLTESYKYTVDEMKAITEIMEAFDKKQVKNI